MNTREISQVVGAWLQSSVTNSPRRRGGEKSLDEIRVCARHRSIVKNAGTSNNYSIGRERARERACVAPADILV